MQYNCQENKNKMGITLKAGEFGGCSVSRHREQCSNEFKKIELKRMDISGFVDKLLVTNSKNRWNFRKDELPKIIKAQRGHERMDREYSKTVGTNPYL